MIKFSILLCPKFKLIPACSAGVFLLTLYSDHAFRMIFRRLGKTVPDNWDEIITKALNKNKKSTIAGTILLGIGFIL